MTNEPLCVECGRDRNECHGHSAGLIVIDGQCLGYLFHSPEHGTFEPSQGRVNYTKEEVTAHNKALSQAEIDGLDQNCEVGQRGTFYLDEEPLAIRTWIGELVTSNVRKRGRVVTFRRQGKVFRGQVSDGGMLRFRRIA